MVDKNSSSEYDVIIVGSGPAGSTCAALLGKGGASVLLLDKAVFPRDKTCGDALSGKSIAILEELGLTQDIQKIPHSDISGVTFSSPDGTVIKIPMKKNKDGQPMASGYCVRREVYDDFLHNHAKKFAECIDGFTVSDVIAEDGYFKGVIGKDKDGVQKEYRAKVIVGADGAISLIARKAGLFETDGKHCCAAVRTYYKGVTGMDDTIELHFADRVLPGYFWIFPLEDGLANVGVGMLLKDIAIRKINLEKIMQDLIDNDPLFKARFANAERVTPVKAWNLPFASKRRKACGNGFMLIGDAASLIDPFTGEGMGNSMTSGSIAAKYILNALKTGDFSEKAFKAYDEELWKTIGPEVKTSYYMQLLGGHAKFLLNFVMHKVAKSEAAREAIAGTLVHPDARKNYYSPLFYLKLLFS